MATSTRVLNVVARSEQRLDVHLFTSASYALQVDHTIKIKVTTWVLVGTFVMLPDDLLEHLSRHLARATVPLPSVGTVDFGRR
jgi:hypothetical protein